MAYRSFQAAAQYLTQAMRLISSAERGAAVYQDLSGNTNERNKQLIERYHKTAIRAATQAKKYIEKGIEKLGGEKGDEDDNSWN